MFPNNIFSTGSNFCSETTTMILSGSSYQHIESREIDVACEKIKELLRSKGKIDLPFIINELKIPTETAIKAVNKLRAEGYIKFDNE